jgi:RNA polymerase sigma factor (sigma-70 family)
VEQATRATSGVPVARRRQAGTAARRLPRRLLRSFGDERLVTLLRGGHDEAFEAIYDRYQAAILSFCRHMLGARSEGEDAAQQTFLSAYQHIVASKAAIALRPWLYAIARNNCLSQLRSRNHTLAMDEIVAEVPDTDGLVEQVQRRHDLRAMLSDLARLPEEQRAALVLSQLGDLTHKEIAGVLGCEPRQVKALVYQARSSLMADRNARELDCGEIRERLAVARGHELLRGQTRRHLRSCQGCREFAADVKRQRRDLALILPVIPTLAFRHSTLAQVLGSAGGGVAPATGVVGVAGKGFALKALVAAVVAAGVGAGVAVVDHGHAVPSRSHARRRPAEVHTSAGAALVHTSAGASIRPVRPRHETARHSRVAPTATPKGAQRQLTSTGRSAPVPTPAHPFAPTPHARSLPQSGHPRGGARGRTNRLSATRHHSRAHANPARGRAHNGAKRRPFHAVKVAPPPTQQHGGGASRDEGKNLGALRSSSARPAH